MLMLSLVALILAGSGDQTAPRGVPADTKQCLPRDEAARKPDFFSFRAQLQMAVARRDLQAVLAVTDPEIKTSFGNDDGIAEFRRQLTDPAGEHWKQLATVLALGGWFEDDGSFIAPYTSACSDGGEVVITGSNVRIRSKPSSTATTLSSVSFVVLVAQYVDEEWYEVELEGKAKGFVAAAYARDPIDYRASFKRVRGQWKMTVFIAGD
jgi:hypothetical protein